MQRDVHHGLLALFAVALAAASTAACQKDASLDPFIGPSELALSLALSATPDVLPLDGASQSLVSILARDGSGQVLANVTLRLQIRFGGVLQDYGQLSGRTLVTGQDGRAVATYTAPLAVSGIDADAQVQIEVTPIGDNYASAVPRSLTIRLVPSGVVIPPFTITAGFRFTPSSPARFQEVLFETNCLSATDANCVTDASGQIASLHLEFRRRQHRERSDRHPFVLVGVDLHREAHRHRRVQSQHERLAVGDRRHRRHPDSGVRVLAGAAEDRGHRLLQRRPPAPRRPAGRLCPTPGRSETATPAPVARCRMPSPSRRPTASPSPSPTTGV